MLEWVCVPLMYQRCKVDVRCVYGLGGAGSGGGLPDAWRCPADSPSQTQSSTHPHPSPQFRIKQTPVGAAPAPTVDPGTLDAVADAAVRAEAAAAAAAEAGALAGTTNGGSDDKPQRFRSTTLLRRPGAGMERAGELMRASQGTGAARAGAWGRA